MEEQDKERTFMMPQAEALYNLQEIDLNILRLRRRLEEIATILADNAALNEAQQRVDAAQAALLPLRTKLRDVELEMQSNAQKAKSAEDRMYSGKVQNPKELQDLQNEVASLSRRNDQLETRVLEAMMAIETAEDDLQQKENDLRQITEGLQTQHGDLLEEKQRIEDEIEALSERRERALNAVTAESLKLYNTMHKRKGNQPIARLIGNSCSVCGIQQTNAVVQEVHKRDSLVECSNCGRILTAG
jgi:predicted  nucleic acid-binding Zn-ribbon protein